ncbi:MAG TPA: phosphotransferase [Solirubrobacteraceae bacterium]
MPEPLDALLDGTGQPGLVELRAALRRLVGDDATVLSQRAIKPRVHRVRLAASGGEWAVVLKRHDAVTARRNLLALRVWLPAVGLDRIGPAVLAIAADSAAGWAWHAYEDLGDGTLDGAGGDDPRVAAAAALVAEVHGRSLDHPVLAHCRRRGAELGIGFFEASVREAAEWVERVQRTRPAGARAELCERLGARLARLIADLPAHAEALERYGGPQTLLHGDLWKSNTFAVAANGGVRARLIDWDHAGVGPLAYDLSTFLSRFRAADRLAVFAAYRDAIERFGVQLPAPRELERAFRTAELGRLATCVEKPALEVTETQAAWAWEELAARDAWFAALEPVLT